MRISTATRKAFGKIVRLKRRETMCMANYKLNLLREWVNHFFGFRLPGGYRYAKVVGLLRSGTNYLDKLLHVNFRTILLGEREMGWKHGPCQYEISSDFIFICKNPYSWIVSFKHWEEIHSRIGTISLTEFLESPVSHPEFRKVWGAKDVIDAWNKALNSWMRYEGRSNTLFIKYENLICDFENQMKLIRNKLKYHPKNADFVNITLRADNWKTQKPRRKLNIHYYLNEEYMREYTGRDLQIIRDNIDTVLATKLGYEIL